VLPRNVSADLLDANETTWTFGVVGGVGRVNTSQVKRLAALAGIEVCRSYCGRIADAGHRPESRRRESGRWPCEAEP
jgi:hypothetical protein